MADGVTRKMPPPTVPASDCDEPHGSSEKMTTAEREMARLLNQPGVSEND
ncbi:hypothetical protein IE982_06530 [Enterobacter hormaechei]|nr:hypothetical protein [Enterobacter hormaechei]